MILETGDIIRVTYSPWNLETLKEALPGQVPDNLLYGSQPISKIAEVDSVYIKKFDNNDRKVYALRFLSGHTLEVTDDFVLHFCVKLGKNVNHRDAQ
jgi:hypothetical protein